MLRISILFFLLVQLNLGAQQYNNDAQIWAHISLQKKLSKHWDAHLKIQGRQTNNLMDFGKAWADIGVGFHINKNIKILVDYVFNQKRRLEGYYKTQHQYYVALMFKKDWNYFRLIYRNVFQAQQYNPSTSRMGYLLHVYDRNKLTLKYEATKRLGFYVAEELRFPLNDPRGGGVDRTRSYVGLIINLSKHQQIEFYYLYQAQLRNPYWYDQEDSDPPNLLKRYYIYGLGYNINF